MIRPPAFWTSDSWPARWLAPIATVVTAVTARRVARSGWRAPVPVICCGNATVGGAGKTTLVLDLAHRLKTRGAAVHILSRGYRGAVKAPRRVLRSDTVTMTGDEALLLAEAAPTWTGADRAASARLAVAAGAEILLMDDGLQNPSLEKTLSLLVVDGRGGFGNGRVLPAGPLREPVTAAAGRCRAAIVIGPNTAAVLSQLPPALPVLRADPVQGDEIAALVGRRALAFAGIGDPHKFFDALERAGVVLTGRKAFPDHHVFTSRELTRLRANARDHDAALVTTPKDAVRLPPGMIGGMAVNVVGVRLVWQSEAAIEALLDEFIPVRTPNPSPGASQSMA
jgi:tetraacyldisaccharide 4'-kinase